VRRILYYFSFNLAPMVDPLIRETGVDGAGLGISVARWVKSCATVSSSWVLVRFQ
jgi:hypothetical protein